MITELIIHRPDDMHLHLRDGEMLKAVTPHTSSDFGRAVIMPNLVPPITTTEQARDYRDRIMSNVPNGHSFDPLMTLYLTESIDLQDLVAGANEGIVKAVKLYPAGATTNSASGVQDLGTVMPVLEKMAEIGLPLLVHGEVTTAEVDIFDREKVFIEKILNPLCKDLPDLKLVLEHITTKDGIEFVKAGNNNVAGTITTHHLMINRNHLLVGGIKPHYYCLPIAKREEHRLSLLEAAISGDAKFFLGTDSAPHSTADKESSCGCAGIFSSINTMSCLAHVFEGANSLDTLEAFASLNGAAFYGLEPNLRRTRLVKQSAPVAYPESIQVAEKTVTVFDPGHPIHWRVENIGI
ncbi:MAG: dihydroorotase [Sneathiella sp.]